MSRERSARARRRGLEEFSSWMAQRRADYDYPFGLPPHAPETQEVPDIEPAADRGRQIGKGKGTGTKGLPEQGVTSVNVSANAQAVIELSKTMKALARSLDPTARSFDMAATSKFDIEKLFKSLPKAIQQLLLSKKRKLEDLIKKLHRAQSQVEELEKKRHPLAKALENRKLQVSREELADAALLTPVTEEPMNLKVEWENLCKAQADAVNVFMIKKVKYQVRLYIRLCSLTSWGDSVVKDLQEYLEECKLAYTSDDAQQLQNVTCAWVKFTHQSLLSSLEHKAAAKAKKKSKYLEDLATANGRLEMMTTNQLIAQALLENNAIHEYKPKTDGKVFASAGEEKTKATVTSNSVLGKLLRDHPDLASKYRVKVVDNITLTKPVLSKCSSAQGPLKSALKKRSPSSASSSSKNSSRSSKNSSRSSRSSSRTSSSRASRSSKSSSRPSTFSSDSKGSFKKKLQKRSHSPRARSPKSSNKKVSFQKGSSKQRGQVFRKTPRPSPRK